MEQENEQIGAVRVLVNAVRLAQSRGVFSLEEASLVHKSVKVLTTPPEERAAEYTNAVAAMDSNADSAGEAGQ